MQYAKPTTDHMFPSLGKGGNLMRNKIEQMKKKGQGLVEYALILVLIAIVVILILTFLGSKVNSTFSTIGSGLK
jgi:pilus assembly protein Flp/PilA